MTLRRCRSRPADPDQRAPPARSGAALRGRLRCRSLWRRPARQTDDAPIEASEPALRHRSAASAVGRVSCGPWAGRRRGRLTARPASRLGEVRSVCLRTLIISPPLFSGVRSKTWNKRGTWNPSGVQITGVGSEEKKTVIWTATGKNGLVRTKTW